MKKPNWKKIRKWSFILFLTYISLGVALYFLQDKFIFHPEPLPADHQYSFNVPFREINLPVSNDQNLNMIQFTVPDSSSKGVVLYFHGNKKNIYRYAPRAIDFTKNGYEVWMIDYPGYGKSTGKLTEKILYEEALLMYRMAISKYAADSIIIYGKSLGTGIASQLASVRDCKRLILETPYYSMDAMAKNYFFIYPVVPMSKYSFPTFEHIRNLRIPITIFHGTKDRVIPYSQAKRLKKLRPTTELITIQGGKHNDLAEHALFKSKLDSLLKL